MYKNNYQDIFQLSDSGKFIISANAGSGKTWQISTLYCFKIASNSQYSIDNIIVNTFTKAATNELKQNIVARLNEFLAALSEDNNCGLPDNIWQELINDKAQVIERLKEALKKSELIQVYTIHSFMQKILAEYFINSPEPIKNEIVDTKEESQLWMMSLAYVWRNGIFTEQIKNYIQENSLSTSLIELINESDKNNLAKEWFFSRYPSVDKLKTNLQMLHNNIKLQIDCPWQQIKEGSQPDYREFITTSQKLAKKLIEDKDKIIENTVEVLNGQRYKLSQVENALAVCVDFLQSAMGLITTAKNKPEDINKAFTKFDISELTNNIPKKTKNWKALPIYSEVSDFYRTWLNDIGRLIDYIDYLLINYSFTNSEEYFNWQLANYQKITYNQIIEYAHQLICNSKNSSKIISEFQKKTKVLLIDEFQDTDTWQWDIYRKLSNEVGVDNSDNLPEQTPKLLLVVVGDAKQSIYQFRMADIYTYLRASEEMTAKLILGGNYRSSKNVVAAVNQLFTKDGAFVNEKITYNPVKAMREFPAAMLPHTTCGQPYKLLLIDKKLTNKGDKAQFVNNDMVQRIIALRRKMQEKGATSPSIAVLVNDNKQCNNIVKILGQHNIAATTESEKYDATPILSSLCHWLLAIANTYRYSKNNFSEDKFANLINLFLISKVDFSNLLFSPIWLGEKEEVFEFWQILIENDFANLTQNQQKLLDKIYQQLNNFAIFWQKNGLFSLINILQNSGIKNRIIKLGWDSRDWQTLKETALYLAASTDNFYQQIYLLKLIINQEINISAQYQQEENSRLDNPQNVDEKPIVVSTIFKAKGLQWDYVFCPTASEEKAENSEIKKGCYYQEKSGGHDIKAGWRINFSQNLSIEIINNISNNLNAEAVRKFYVLLTRAKFGCFVYWQVESDKKVNTHSCAELVDKIIAINVNNENSNWQVIQLLQDINQDVKQDINQNINLQARENINNDFPTPSQDFIFPELQKIYLPTTPTLSFTSLSREFKPKLLIADVDENAKIEEGATEISISQLINEEMFSADDEKKDILSQEFSGIDFGIAVHLLIAESLQKYHREKSASSNFANCREINLEEIISETILRNSQYQIVNSNSENTDNKVAKDYQQELLSFTLCALNQPLTISNLQQQEIIPPLINLSRQEIITEWQFLYSWQNINNKTWEKICTNLELTNINIVSGSLLNGSIDALLQYQEKFYIIDFKTNIVEIGKSDEDTLLNLEKAVKAHNYQLQALIYQMALHCYLSANLPDYHPEKNLGGVCFNFLRLAKIGKPYCYFIPSEKFCISS